MTDYAAVLAVTHPGAEWGIARTYAELAQTWRDAAPLPSQAELDAAWPAVEADIALIQDDPTESEVIDVAIGTTTGTDADRVRARRTSAAAARRRIP